MQNTRGLFDSLEGHSSFLLTLPRLLRPPRALKRLSFWLPKFQTSNIYGGYFCRHFIHIKASTVLKGKGIVEFGQPYQKCYLNVILLTAIWGWYYCHLRNEETRTQRSIQLVRIQTLICPISEFSVFPQCHIQSPKVGIMKYFLIV